MTEWSDDAGVSEDEVAVEVVEVVVTDEAGDVLADDELLVLEEVEDAELVLPVWTPTGEPRVDSALDLLAQLDPDDVHKHAPVFDEVHQQLRAALTDLDTLA